jgi:hypothetical protein
MIARICLGAKCSKTLMGIHFSGNPGVTPAVKDFLTYKMKARKPQNQSEITN